MPPPDEGDARGAEADAGARLEQGRMLVEMHRDERAAEMLAPVVQDRSVDDAVRGRAAVERGRALLRMGRSVEAERALRRAIELAGEGAEARRLLRAARRARAPRLRVGTAAARDAQPLRRSSVGLEGGFPLRPWLDMELGVGADRLRADGADERLLSARAGVRGRWEGPALEGGLWGGGFRRSRAGEGDWSAGASAAYHGPGDVWLRVEGRRGPYLRTEASLETPVTVTSAAGALERTDPWRWGGGIRYRKERFSNGTATEEASARMLAPVASGAGAVLRLGYGFRAAGSDGNGFEPVEPVDPRDGAPLPGRYDPVYTPRELRVHALRIDGRYAVDGGLRVTFAGSWGFSAREREPVLFSVIPGAPGAGIDRQFRPRSFTPWSLEARGRLPLSERFVLDVEAGHRRTAFRDVTLLRVGGTFYGASDGDP